MDLALCAARHTARAVKTRKVQPLLCSLRYSGLWDSQRNASTTKAAVSILKAGKNRSSKPQTTDTYPKHDSAEACRYSVRSHTCGELNSSQEGCKVRLSGWVEFTRMDRFLLLRDAYGSTQITVPEERQDLQEVLRSLSFESVAEVEGTVVRRPTGQENRSMATGEIEVVANSVTIVGPATKNLPFVVRSFSKPTEPLQMKHRYLYLRYPEMQRNLRLRSQILHSMRDFLVRARFVEVETPTLFRKTPGGAQEFIVPTQIPGHFYSLVQSPQQFKQLLMVGGLDRYFQIARCYRDESVRSDRQPEFTQLDLELSFVDREGIIALIEDLLVASWPQHLPQPEAPFARMTYKDAMDLYGCDKPDTRFGSQLQDLTHLAEPAANVAPAQQIMADPMFTLRALVFPGAAETVTRTFRSELKTEMRSRFGSAWLVDTAVTGSSDWKKVLLKTLSPSAVDRLVGEVKATPGDFLFLGIGPRDQVLGMLGAIRLRVADMMEASGACVRTDTHNFLWVVDFPLFEPGDDGCLQAAHHPFTQPHPEDLQLLETDPLKVRGLHYDLVLNGAEIGGGSIRISDPGLQERVLRDLLRIDTSSLQHLVDALSMGAPPHGGIALGLDRLLAIICGASSIRDVIAFPKGIFGKDPMSMAPAPLTAADAKLYSIPFPPETSSPTS